MSISFLEFLENLESRLLLTKKTNLVYWKHENDKKRTKQNKLP